MTVESIQLRAGKFEGSILWRNAREYLAALAMVIFFTWEFFRASGALARIGFGLMIAGMLYMAWHLYRRGSPRGTPQEMGLTSGVDFFKRELERQRDLLQSVWQWYLGPIIPGWVLLMVSTARAGFWRVGPFLVVLNLGAAMFFVFVWKLNQRAARELQRQIDELDSLAERAV